MGTVNIGGKEKISYTSPGEAPITFWMENQHVPILVECLLNLENSGTFTFNHARLDKDGEGDTKSVTFNKGETGAISWVTVAPDLVPHLEKPIPDAANRGTLEPLNATHYEYTSATGVKINVPKDIANAFARDTEVVNLMTDGKHSREEHWFNSNQYYKYDATVKNNQIIECRFEVRDYNPDEDDD